MATSWKIVTPSSLGGLMRDVINADSSGVQSTIINLIRTYGGGTGNVFIKPDSSGKWPNQSKRAPGSTLMWLRHIDGTRLADMPTSADGYVTGDLVYPIDEAAAGPSVIFSDSFLASPSALVNVADGYTGDAFAGGARPTWSRDTSSTESGARVRLGPNGFELYSVAYAWVTTPAVPPGAWSASMRITDIGDNTSVDVGLRGTTYKSADSVWVRFRRSGNTMTAQLVDRAAAVPVTPMLSATVTNGVGPVGLTLNGSFVSASIGGDLSAPYNIASTVPPMQQFTLHAPYYNYAWVRDLKVVAL